jgi:ABC-type oligopeptide transport system ATPase subunit
MADFGLPSDIELDSELKYETARYDKEEQLQQFNQLNLISPNTEEMDILFQTIAQMLEFNQSDIFLLQGQAGCGKSTFAKKIVAYSRACGHIVLGCASTALAATVYENFHTAHYLFKIPIMEDEEDYDQEQDLQCTLHEHPQRMELLNAARVIIWDEIGSQHLRDFKAVYNVMQRFRGKIVLLMGDNRQIAPVIVGGSRSQIVEASIYCSEFRRNFRYFCFTKNMRLLGAEEEEVKYAKLLLSIGSGENICEVNNKQIMNVYLSDVDNIGNKILGIYNQRIFLDRTEAIDFLYPNGFGGDDYTSVCVLASTNELVDVWNSAIQELNPNDSVDLLSQDNFNDVDDINGNLRSMLDERVLNRYADNSCPPHLLKLKIGDICILLRHCDKKNGLSNNSRCEVVMINQYLIRVKTLNSHHPYYTNICRFRFKVKLPYGHSFTMLRTQFPLRLAYSMTFNRSQGQEYLRTLVDLTSNAFAHGHCYVAMSRVRWSTNIAFYTTEDRVMYAGILLINNVVYDEILKDE